MQKTLKNESPKNKSFGNRKVIPIFSLRARLCFLMMLYIITGFLILLIFIIPIMTSTLTTYTNAILSEIVTAKGEKIDSLYQDFENSLVSFGQSGSVSSYLAGVFLNPHKSQTEIESYMVNYPLAKNCSVVNTSGEILLSTDKGLVGQSVADTDYFRSAADADGARASGARPDPLPGSSGNVIAFTCPMYYIDDYVGIILVTTDVDALFESIIDIQVLHTGNSLAFLTDTDGSLLYHPDTAKQGQPFENNEISQVIDPNISSLPEDPKIGYFIYKQDGHSNYAAYRISPLSGRALVIAADEDEVLSPVHNISRQAFNIALLISAVCAVLCYFFAYTITKPIASITRLIDKTARLDLRGSKSCQKYKKKKDETGVMAAAMEQMCASMLHTVAKIEETAGHLKETAVSLTGITSQVSSHAQDNSEAAFRLSAAMDEAQLSVSRIQESVESVNTRTREIADQIQENSSLASELSANAHEAQHSTAVSVQQTRKLYEDVKEKTQHAISQAASVSRITELAKAIQSIAGQTSLLSLNASIEAARAGESGRGFSVVAMEIGKLAEESSSTVSHITEIVSQTQSSVNEMSENLETILGYLEETVLDDYNRFMEISERNSSDTAGISHAMEHIAAAVGVLTENMQNIADSITHICDKVTESSNSVGEFSENNREILSLVEQTNRMTEQNSEFAKELSKLVDQFTLS